MQRDVGELIHEVETAWIPLCDGRRLAARLFLPRSALSTAVPAVLEYLPYRRRDGTRPVDDAVHRWFAAHGYACARVDVAGTGDSDGVLQDEYAPREQDDGLEVLAWLAAQPWCTGSVGMIGISWGGFNGLQLAARRPPALRAVVSLCAAVDRYRGDCHYLGGRLNEENLEWGAQLFTIHGLPPDPEVVGWDRWRDLWRQRIGNAVLPPAEWLRHQRRDGYWRHGSVCEDYGAIETPVLAVSGWADGYPAAVFDLVEHLQAPCKGIIGPWGHLLPQRGVPGPAIGFLQEALRWWDRWLSGRHNGAEDEPAMRLWVQEPHPPAAHLAERPGRWVAFDRWPDDAPDAATWSVHAGRLEPAPPSADGGAERCWEVDSPLTVGLAGGQWCAYGMGTVAHDLPTDQRDDDAGSLVFDSAALSGPLHVVGRPRVRLRCTSDRPVAFLAVRLCDVHPDDTSERLSFGVVNLAHRVGDTRPEPVVAGAPVEVELELKGVAQHVPAGHRLRLALSTSYWPMVWPSPEAATVTVAEAGLRLELPVWDGASPGRTVAFGEPEEALAGPVTVRRPAGEHRRVVRSDDDGSTEVEVWRDDGVWRIEAVGTEQTFTRRRRSAVLDGRPTSATATVQCVATHRRDAWDTRVETEVTLTCDATTFRVQGRLTAFDGGELVAERRFDDEIPRDHL